MKITELEFGTVERMGRNLPMIAFQTLISDWQYGTQWFAFLC